MEVLVVEDDAALRDVLCMHLESDGWRVRAAADGDAALRECAERLPDLVVLDVMLPGRSGLEVCATLRALYHPSPGVLMVTARDSEFDVILGFEVGADDYVVKPCRPRELAARLRAVARRLGATKPEAGAPALTRGRISADLAARRITVDGELLRLTPSELELLVFLMRAPSRVFTRMELLAEVFDSTHEGYSRNVDCHITRLRRKIEAAGWNPSPIRTVRGSGYVFEVGDE